MLAEGAVFAAANLHGLHDATDATISVAVDGVLMPGDVGEDEIRLAKMPRLAPISAVSGNPQHRLPYGLLGDAHCDEQKPVVGCDSKPRIV